MEQREFLSNITEEVDLSSPTLEECIIPEDEYENARRFHELRKYIQLDTNEYIAMKIYVEVEDPVIGKKSTRIGSCS